MMKEGNDVTDKAETVEERVVIENQIVLGETRRIVTGTD